MLTISIIHEPVWKRIEPFLHIVECAQDGGLDEPRIRIEFLRLPEQVARELVMYSMPCVACQRPNHPLRRRVGDDWDRLFYAPTCPITVRMSCSRTRAAELEYDRFKGIAIGRIPNAAQLSLF